MSAQTCQTAQQTPADAARWVDEYIARVRPYVFVRVEDNLLIKRPNVACGLNPSGARVLKALLDGATFAAVTKHLAHVPGAAQDIVTFLVAVRHYLEGRLNEFCANPAVTRRVHPLVFSTLPVLGEFALTYRCNLRCGFCYVDAASRRVSEDDEPGRLMYDAASRRGSEDDEPGRRLSGAELTLREQKRIITIMAEDARLPSLSFTGGEPLLVPHLPELIRHAKALGMRVNLITNGTLLDARMAGRLAAAGLDSAQVSIEGVSAATHDALVGMPGAFARSIAALRHLRAAGIHAHGNTTVTRANYDECAAMPRFVRDTLGGERFSMNLLIPTGSGAAHRDLQVRYSEIGPLVEALHAESARCGVEFMWYAPLPLCLFNTIAAGIGAKGCGACDGLLSVAPNGDVLPCSACAEPAGNLLRTPFADVWSSEHARAYRHKRFAPERCRACPELNLCNGACTLYWRAFGCAELSPVRAVNEHRT